MDPGALAARRMRAVNSLVESSAIIAHVLGLDSSVLQITNRDATVRSMLQIEAVAEFMKVVESKVSPSQPMPTEADRLSNLTVSEAVPIIEAINSVEELQALENAEDSGKQRSGIFNAIDRRRSELEAESEAENGSSN